MYHSFLQSEVENQNRIEKMEQCSMSSANKIIQILSLSSFVVVKCDGQKDVTYIKVELSAASTVFYITACQVE